MSQSADLLALLSDGRPHEMRSIHRAIGFCRLNSRVSELRGRGYSIVCDKSNREYVYTLISRPLEDDDNGRTGDVASSRSPGHSLATEAAPSSSSGCVSGVLPDNDRVDTNVQSPAPLDKSETTRARSSLASSGRGTDGETQSPLVASAPFPVLPGGQLTLRWAA